jgi:MFS superfamily sulfate permease-like transporter
MPADPASGLYRAARRFLSAIPPVPPQALAAFHVAVGTAILAGDGKRFSGPSLAGAREVAALFGVPADKAWILWGTTLTVVGLVVLLVWPWVELRHARAALCIVLAGSVPMIFLVVGFIFSLQLSEVASTPGIGAYGALAVAHLHTAVKMIRGGCWDRRQPNGTWERRVPFRGVQL